MMPLFGLFSYPNLTTHHSKYRCLFKMSDPIRHAELTSQILPQLSPAQLPQLQGHISHSRALRLRGWLPQSEFQSFSNNPETGKKFRMSNTNGHHRISDIQLPKDLSFLHNEYGPSYRPTLSNRLQMFSIRCNRNSAKSLGLSNFGGTMNSHQIIKSQCHSVTHLESEDHHHNSSIQILVCQPILQVYIRRMNQGRGPHPGPPKKC